MPSSPRLDRTGWDLCRCRQADHVGVARCRTEKTRRSTCRKSELRFCENENVRREGGSVTNRELRVKVPLRECVTRTRLQVSFESHRRLLSPELQTNIEHPRPRLHGRWILAGVVCTEARRYVGCQSDVPPRRVVHATQNVDKPFCRSRHAGRKASRRPTSKRMASIAWPRLMACRP